MGSSAEQRIFAAGLIVAFCALPFCWSKAWAVPCVQEAEALHKKGQYSEALSKLKGCPESRDRLLLFGHLLWKLRRHKEAKQTFEQYLEVATPKEQDDVKRLIGELTVLISTRISVTSDPAGATVHLGDPYAPSIGKTPLNTGVQPGSCTLYLRHPGFKDAAVQVVARAGSTAAANAVLLEIPAAPPPKPLPPPPKVAKPPSPLPWIVSGAVTVVAGGVALGLGLSARSARNDYDNHPSCPLRETIKNRALAADVMIGVTAAAAVTTGVLYYLYHRKKGKPPTDSGISIRGRGAGFSVSF